MSRFRPIAALCLALLLLACTPQAEPAPAPWSVEVNLYSGRQNPGGALNAVQTAELLQQVAALESAAPRAPGGLGYSGFTLRASHPAGAAIVVFDGVVAVTEGNATRYLADPERALEQWLFRQLETADWLTAAEKELIRAQLPVAGIE